MTGKPGNPLRLPRLSDAGDQDWLQAQSRVEPLYGRRREFPGFLGSGFAGGCRESKRASGGGVSQPTWGWSEMSRSMLIYRGFPVSCPCRRTAGNRAQPEEA